MNLAIERIFDKAQLSSIYHNKLVKKLIELHDKQDNIELFKEKVILCLKYAIVNGKKAQAIRVFDFGSKFIASLEVREREATENKHDREEEEEEEEIEDPTNTFVAEVLRELLKVSGCRSQSSRMRVCYFIKKILQCLGPKASIDNDICEDIYSAMLERLKDRSPSVRAQAVTALERLQDPTNPDCLVVKAFLFHMSMDPSAEVRRAVLLCLGRSKQSLPYIRNRIHDVKDSVRKQAYLSLSKVTVKSHSIKSRELILSQGLKDSSDCVREDVEKVLLPNWLENCQGNFMEFLHVLDVENSEIAEKALKVLLRQHPKETLIKNLGLNSDKLIPPEKQTVEMSFYWRCLAEFLQSEEDDLWELVLPELSLYCEYVNRYLESVIKMNKSAKLEPWDHTQNDFIVIQLLLLMKVFDLGDEVGREKLKQLLLDMLVSSDVRLKVITTIMDVLVKVIPDVDTRLALVTETISEIHDPLVDNERENIHEITSEEKRELEYKIAQLRVQRNILEGDMQLAIEERKFLVAEELKNKLAETNKNLESLTVNKEEVEVIPAKNRLDDPGILSKCLTIVYEMMQSPTVKTLSSHLRSLMDNFVKNSLQVEHAIVQVLSLQCLTVFSLLDESIAKEVIVIFCLYLGSTCDEIAQVAVKGIFDLLLMYGLKTFAIREEDGDVVDENISLRKKQKKNLMRQSTFIDDSEDEFVTDKSKLSPEDETHEVETKDYCLLSLLIKHLDSSQGQLLNTVVEGMCKLLYAMRISSPKLLSRLILLWFNPVHDDDHLRQILGLFFKTYAISCPISQETLEQCFVPTINTVHKAPCSSPFSQVDLLVVTKFLLDLTKTGVNRFSSEVNVHNNLALQFCNEMLKDEFDYIKPELINILCHMELSLDDEMKKNMMIMVEKLKKACPERSSLRAIQKFETIINTNRRSSETLIENSCTLENTDMTSTSSRLRSKCGSSMTSSSSETERNSFRNKALRTESNGVIPLSSDVFGVIPETSESDNDSVFD